MSHDDGRPSDATRPVQPTTADDQTRPMPRPERAVEPDHDRPPVPPAPVRPSERPPTDPHGPGTTFFTNHPDDVAAREKDAYGGVHVGSAFFGWLVAVGLTVLLLGLLSVVGLVLGVTTGVQGDGGVPAEDLSTAGVVGLVGVGVGLFLAYVGGGYVAGRMARFDGLKQGLAVWLWAVVVSALLAVVGYLAGDRFDVLAQVDTLGLPVSAADLTTAGAVAAGAVLVISLLGALLGGAAGTRYHRKVDRVGLLNDPGPAEPR